MSGSGRFRTLDSIRKDKDDNDPEDPGSDNDRQQSFYVGGGEHSGQEVLGGKDDLVKKFFRVAEQHGARVEEEPHSSSRPGPGRAKLVGGYRLGDSVVPSEKVVPGAEMPDALDEDDDEEEEVQRVVMRMWANGFTLDDGPLRSFEDPANAAFLNEVMHRVTPKELLQKYRGKTIDLQIERKTTDYEPPRAAAPKPFAGQGQRLGEIEPVVAGSGKVGVKYGQDTSSSGSGSRISNEAVQSAQEAVQMQAGEPTTQLQLRFPDGQRIIGRFNHSHTLEDVRTFIVSAAPNLAFSPFNLMTTFPNRVIENETASLADTGLLNSVILIKYV